MSFIRDNILKIFIMTIIIVILIIGFSACSRKGNPTTTEEKYENVESQMIEASKSLISDQKRFLPTKVGQTKKILLSKLVKNNKMNQPYANENRNYACKGYVTVKLKDKDDYFFRAFLNCGKYYKTRTMADYILKTEEIVTKDTGLYQEGAFYVYKGENPNNRVLIGERLYRIIYINNKGELKLVSTKAFDSTSWDDRYNSEVNKNYGINNFDKSRLRDALDLIYNPVEKYSEFLTDERKFVTDHDFCISKISIETVNSKKITREDECKDTYSMKVGLINPSDYLGASIDPMCNSSTTEACQNYNYFYSITSAMSTMNAVSNDTYEVYTIDEGVVNIKKAYISSRMYPVIYLDKSTFYKSGDGSELNPYIIR